MHVYVRTPENLLSLCYHANNDRKESNMHIYIYVYIYYIYIIHILYIYIYIYIYIVYIYSPDYTDALIYHHEKFHFHFF
jgi:hypothetical protein